MASPELAKTLNIKTAIIKNIVGETEEKYDEVVELDLFSENSETYRTSLLLFELSEEEMLDLTENGNATLEVFYEFLDTGEPGSKILRIERYQYKDIAWPT